MFYKGPLLRADGSLIIPRGKPHNCYYASGWNRAYSHTAVAVLLTNRAGNIAAVVARHPDEPDQGGLLCLPGGYVELGQILARAAVTEVREETGYRTLPGTLTPFAIMDGPSSLPGRQNEHNLNIVHVFHARAGRKVQEHDDEVTGMHWISSKNMPPRRSFAFGHYDIIRMWYRHRRRPFGHLPIYPSGMSPSELF